MSIICPQEKSFEAPNNEYKIFLNETWLHEFIQHRIDNQLGHGQSIQVKEGVNDLLQLRHLGCVDSAHDIHFPVVIDCPGPSTIAAELMMLRVDKVDDVENDGDNGYNTVKISKKA